MDATQKSLVVLNGSKPPRSLVQQFWNGVDCRICADGAAEMVKTYGFEPDVIIGDFDSVSANFEAYFPTAKIIKDPDQESTDGEKALNYSLVQNYLDITVLGALGNRLDHTLYNLSLLKTFTDRKANITIYSEQDKITLANKNQILHESIGTRVSLMPVYGSVENVKTEGLKYNLTGQTLDFGVFCSTSNEFEEEAVSISIGAGDLLIVIERNE